MVPNGWLAEGKIDSNQLSAQKCVPVRAASSWFQNVHVSLVIVGVKAWRRSSLHEASVTSVAFPAPDARKLPSRMFGHASYSTLSRFSTPGLPKAVSGAATAWNVHAVYS